MSHTIQYIIFYIYYSSFVPVLIRERNYDKNISNLTAKYRPTISRELWHCIHCRQNRSWSYFVCITIMQSLACHLKKLSCIYCLISDNKAQFCSHWTFSWYIWFTFTCYKTFMLYVIKICKLAYSLHIYFFLVPIVSSIIFWL